MNFFVARNVLRYQFRYKTATNDDCLEECCIPFLVVNCGHVFTATCVPCAQPIIYGIYIALVMHMQSAVEAEKNHESPPGPGYLVGYQPGNRTLHAIISLVYFVFMFVYFNGFIAQFSQPQWLLEWFLRGPTLSQNHPSCMVEFRLNIRRMQCGGLGPQWQMPSTCGFIRTTTPLGWRCNRPRLLPCPSHNRCMMNTTLKAIREQSSHRCHFIREEILVTLLLLLRRGLLFIFFCFWRWSCCLTPLSSCFSLLHPWQCVIACKFTIF